MKTKLTKAQQGVLDKLKSGDVAHYMPYMGSFNPSPYWFLSSNMKRCTKQIRRLIDLGLVKIIQDGFHSTRAIAIEQNEDKKEETNVIART